MTTVNFRIRTRDITSIREWLKEHSKPELAALPAREALAAYVESQLISSAQYDGQHLNLLRTDPVTVDHPTKLDTEEAEQ